MYVFTTATVEAGETSAYKIQGKRGTMEESMFSFYTAQSKLRETPLTNYKELTQLALPSMHKVNG